MHAFEAKLDARWPPRGEARRCALAGVILLHAAAVFAWWQLPPDKVQRVAPARIMAFVVGAQGTTEAHAAPRIAIARTSRPKPAIVPVPEALANESAPGFTPMPHDAPASATAATPMESAPVVVAATEPAAPSPSTTPPPAPVVPPRFDAEYLDNAPPAYPSLSRQFREQGVVMLDVHVTQSGMPDAVDIRRSSGSPRLDEAARAAVLRWRFVPARRGDTPITAWVVVPVRFALAG